MYRLNDTIVAVSSPTSEQRTIVRISGPGTTALVQRIFNGPIPAKGGAISGSIAIDAQMRIDARLYLFRAPHSYTGEDVAEIHTYTNSSVTEALIGGLLSSRPVPVRPAGPGEFTARAYLNGKLDLAQAEAVNEIIVSSNKYQLDAAEKLLAGRLAETGAKVRADIMDCLTLLEAGLDFSQEDIEFVTRPDAVERLTEIKNRLQLLLSGSITYESVIDLPAVGIAGAPNAGKSTLLNTLLGRARSIVSHRHQTTRDVLTGMLTLPHTKCILFDCAGLLQSPAGILDELSQQAAIEAIRNSLLVIFCVDVSKTGYSEDINVRRLIEPGALIPVASKADLLAEDVLAGRLRRLNELFAARFIPISAKLGKGAQVLRDRIDETIVGLSVGSAELTGPLFSDAPRESAVALTARHRHAVSDAVENITEAADELKNGSDEITAMLLRAAYQSLSTIERENIDEQVLERIFHRFCVGK
ncbi:MAG: tRNA modification GTPase [Planctomycetota bacterium]|jgi:tRNA modification GTPase